MPPQFPPLYLLENHIPEVELYRLEREIGDDHDGPLVRDIREAKVVIGRLKQKGRALYELRKRGLHTEDVSKEKFVERDKGMIKGEDQSRVKRRKIEKRKDGKEVITVDSSTESENERISSEAANPRVSPPASFTASQEDLFRTDIIKVVKLDWYYDSVKAGILLPTINYLVYEGRVTEKPIEHVSRPPVIAPPQKGKAKEILERARTDTRPSSQHAYRKHQYHKSGSPNSQPKSQRPHLQHESTSDHEQAADLPPLPSYLQAGTYACERSTPMNSPNDDFIEELNIIREQRKLVDPDPKGISYLAYSRAIAAIKAYPYTITIPQEIARLPGVGQKYQDLYQEWRDTGRIQEVEDIKVDERVKSLKIFFDIYDVGAKRAREFYARGWRDLDDVIHDGWNELPHNQQIFVKYYYEFQEKIPRVEVERIGAVVHDYANRCRPGFQSIIVGGYRRGKEESGDVDVIITHPDPEATHNVIEEIVQKLFEDYWVSHQLRISLANSNRDQATVSWKGSMAAHGTGGFDTLDKAFLVWQDADLLREGKKAIHRRVDIIVSPWKTAGCAIVGWSGATLFQRDLRSYSRSKKKLKFDSSGIRTVDDGAEIEFEGDEKTLLGKEKKVFEGLGLQWREPTERCTG